MSKENWIGKEVMILGDHPHSGRTGIVEGFEVAKLANKEGAVIRFDNGDSCFVFDASLLHKVPTKAKKGKRSF